MIYAFLSHWWSGLVIAAVVALSGWLLVRIGSRPGRRPARWIGLVIASIGFLLAIGSAIGLARVALAMRKHPAPGRLVDVGGYRIHILAEGEAKGRPTLIWIPGAHAPGYALYHLHKAIRGEARSILFDRPGTGWSDVGPFPRRTAREAQELATLLEKAGEPGPFILIGHSYGGLLSANFARRYPERTAAVVLLDPTPPDALIYPPVYGPAAVIGGVRAARRQGLRKLFGLASDDFRELARQDPGIGRLARLQDSLGADVREALEATNARPASDFVWASIFGEFAPPNLGETAAQLVVYDGELGDLPVYLVTPTDDFYATFAPLGLSDPDRRRTINFFRSSRQRYLATSTRSELISTPIGTGHNYPLETPEFVVSVVRRVLAEEPRFQPVVKEGYLTTPDSVKLWYRMVGTGPETVIIPAANYHTDRFDGLATPTRKIVLYDLRGRGRSDSVPPEKTGLDRNIADLEAIRAMAGADSVALIGWSAIALEQFAYALRHRSRVTRLVQLAPVGPRWEPYWDSMRVNGRARVDSGAAARLDARVKAGEFANNQAGLCREQARLSNPTGFGDPSRAGQAPDVCDSPNEWPDRYARYVGVLLEKLGKYDWRHRLRDVSAPRLVIHGARDNIPLAGSREWVAGMPNARLLVLPGIGHWPQLESPEQTLGAIRGFLEGRWPEGSEVIPPGPR
jgi:pimeloyl-ACP methyl ester carboxylesterase